MGLSDVDYPPLHPLTGGGKGEGKGGECGIGGELELEGDGGKEWEVE